MLYILDTNICIYIIKKRPLKVLQKLRSHKLSEISISSITYSELQYGVEKSRFSKKNQEALNEFLLPLAIAPFDGNAARAYGKVRTDLDIKGRTIGPLDMMIGAHALSLGAVLVTNNVKEFSRIKALRVQNWAK